MNHLFDIFLDCFLVCFCFSFFDVNDNPTKKMLNIKHFWGLFSIKLLQKTHWYDYIPFVMLKGLCQNFNFWKDLPKFLCNSKKPSQ